MVTIRQLLDVVRAQVRARDEFESEWTAPVPGREDLIYALVEPTRVCVSPGGHEAREIRTYGGVIPIKAMCGICGDRFDIVVTPRA